MKIQTSFDNIESIEFKVNFAVMSGSNAFRLALENHPDVQQLLESIKLAPENTDAVLRRALSLINASHDMAHYHPHDIAIAAYAYVLHQVSQPFARQVADRIMNQPNMWWSRRMAELVMVDTDPQTVESD